MREIIAGVIYNWGLGGVFVELNLRLEYEWIRYVCGRV